MQPRLLPGMGLSVTGYSMPIFWWGLLLIMFVAERWGLTPVSGRIDLIKFYFEPVTGFMVIDAWLSGQKGAVLDALHHLVLPAIVLHPKEVRRGCGRTQRGLRICGALRLTRPRTNECD